MEMTGERRIPASRQLVWEALNDPEALKLAIPGCESVTRTAPDAFEAKVAVKLGPMAAKFGGKVKLENLNPPASYTISGEGSGGAMGFAKGGADVALEEIGPNETLLKYNVKAQVGGKIAQLGARLIDSTAKQMADQFFNKFAANLTPAVAVTEAEPAMAAASGPTPVAGTDTEYMADPARLGTTPITFHGTEPVTGKLDPQANAPIAISPLRMLGGSPFGVPLQAWVGGVICIAIAALMFL